MPLPPAARRRLVTTLVVVLAGTACDEPTGPTAASTPEGFPQQPSTPANADFTGPFSDRARVVDPGVFPLVSTPDDLAAGVYRFRLNGRRPVGIARDDYLITGDSEPVVRTVLHSSVQNGELTVETGPARWSDVLQSGTYGVRLPFVPGSRAAETTAGEQLDVGPESQSIPNMELIFPRTDVCAWIDSALALVGGGFGGALCGTPHSGSVSVPDVVTITVSGTVDSLLILDGFIAVNGGVDLEMTLDAGGISGGRAPVFSPCDRAAYLGCLTTPTGAALIDFLRQYAPSIPDSALPAIRVCIPGSPVRLRRGYWTWSGFTPTYHPPVYTRCSITDFGALPTITYPSISNVVSHINPHLRGSITFKATGDGTLELEIPIPGLSVSAKYSKGSDSTSTGLKLAAEVGAGVFLDLSFTLKNAGAVIHGEFNDSGVVTQQWTESSGWDGGYTRVVSERDAQFTKIPADSAVFVFQPELKAEAKLCLLICGGSDSTSSDADSTSWLGKKLLGLLKITAGAGAVLGKPMALTWTREVVNPVDTTIDNWHWSVDQSYRFALNAGLKFPGKKFVVPNVPVDWKKEWAFDSVHMADMWGRSNLLVQTTTTGAAAPTDPYLVTVTRADTLPVVIADGATPLRVGPATDLGSPLEMNVDPTGSALFAHGTPPCTVFYSDAEFANLPIAGSVVQGLRSHGVGIPNYAIPAFCQMLVARYQVTLGNVPGNCTVDGGSVRDSVWLESRKRSISRSDTTTLAFNVTCDGTAATGNLHLTTAAATTPDYTAAYVLQVDSVPWGRIGPDTTVDITGLIVGSHTLHFSEGPGNCIALDSVVVDILDGATDSVTATPICALPDNTPPPGQITISAVTTGGGGDPSGYLLQLDGVTSASMGDNDLGKVNDVPGLVPSVIQVSDIAGSCRPVPPNPFVVTLDAAASPVTVPFGVTCTASPIDSLSGTVESTAYPTPSVSLRTDDGRVIVLTGDATAELAQLAGMSVRTWGVSNGTSLDVYGYGLISTLANPRWVGIVEERASGLWLFGRDALQLVDPPPGLTADVGALVWVTGTQSGNTITPTSFGIIREVLP